MKYYEESGLDFHYVQEVLSSGCSDVFRHWLDAYSSERFYGFALYGLSDLAFINPSANTLSGYRKFLHKLNTGENRRRNAYNRFAPWNWEKEWPERLYSPFREIASYFSKYRPKEPDERVQGTFRANTFLCMLYVLREMRDNAVSLTTGQNPIMLASVYDNPLGDLLEITSIDYLLPEPARSRVLNVYKNCPTGTYDMATFAYHIRNEIDPIVMTRKLLHLPPL